MSGLVIAGFHRSGTSSVAQHLAHSGLALGDDLIGATTSNPYGHFEDRAPIRMHDRMLQRSGQDWAADAPEPPSPNAQDIREMAAYGRARAAAARGAWGFKDPRVCRFLGHWTAALPGLRVLIVYRSPAAACRSLNRREAELVGADRGDPVLSRRFVERPDHALRLWVSHNRALLEFAENRPQETVVSGHSAFLAGRNLAIEIETRFQLGLVPCPVDETLDPSVLTGRGEPLAICEPRLRDEALAIWERLCQADQTPHPGDAPDPTCLTPDPTGQVERSRLADLRDQAARAMGTNRPLVPERRAGKSRGALARIKRFLGRMQGG